MTPAIHIVAAHDLDQGMGYQGGLPWPRLKPDLAHFKKLTTGKAVVMGWLTYKSIGRPLPDRPTIVLSTDRFRSAPGCHLAQSLDHALMIASQFGLDLAVAGGAALYAEALRRPEARWLHLTRVFGRYPADRQFPPVPGDWYVVDGQYVPADGTLPVPLAFETHGRLDPTTQGPALEGPPPAEWVWFEGTAEHWNRTTPVGYAREVEVEGQGFVKVGTLRPGDVVLEEPYNHTGRVRRRVVGLGPKHPADLEP
jgi:dihydrofolate reductase